MEDLVLSCLESRVEENRNLYARFLVGPFLKGDALTVATALRRVLLSSRESIGITALYVQGITHEFSTIAGVRESVLELSLNFGAIVLSYDKTFFEKKSFFDEIQIGYLQAQGPKVVYANDLKLPFGVKLVDPTQYIATISKEGSIVLKFVIGKRNDLLNQKTSFHNSELDFGKQSIYFPALGELVKKNITRAKKRYFYKGCSTINSFYTKKWFAKPLIFNPLLSVKTCTRTNYPVHLRFLAWWQSLGVVTFGARASCPFGQLPCKPSVCTVANLRFAQRGKRKFRQLAQAKPSKRKRFKIHTKSFPLHANLGGKATGPLVLKALGERKQNLAKKSFAYKAEGLQGQRFMKKFRFVNEKRNFFDRAKFTKLYTIFRSLVLSKRVSKNVQGQALASRQNREKLSPIKMCTWFCDSKQKDATVLYGLRSKLSPCKRKFYKKLKKVSVSSAHAFKALLYKKLREKERQSVQKGFDAMQIKTSLNRNHLREMQTRPCVSTVYTPIKQPFLNPFDATINDNPLNNGGKLSFSSANAHANRRFAWGRWQSHQEKGFKSSICLRNLIPLDLTLTPVLKVNFVIEIDDEVLYLRQKIRERIVIEVWTNGSIHPRQAVHDAALSLTDMFGSFRSVYQAKSYFFPGNNSSYSLQSSRWHSHLPCKPKVCNGFAVAKFSKAKLCLQNQKFARAHKSFYKARANLRFATPLCACTWLRHLPSDFVGAKVSKTKLCLQNLKIAKVYKYKSTHPKSYPSSLFSLLGPTHSYKAFLNPFLLNFAAVKPIGPLLLQTTNLAKPWESKRKIVSIFDRKFFTKQIRWRSKSVVNFDKEGKFFNSLSKKKRNNSFIYQSGLEKKSLFSSDLGELSLPENLYCFLKKKGIANFSTLKAFSSFDLLLLVNGNRDMFCTLKRFLLKYNYPVANP